MTAAGAAKRGDIQGMRAIAVVLVVVYHSGLGLSGGFVGVDVFFVISGYVITQMLTRELATSGRLSFRSFYLRRARRLLPALALMVSVVSLVGVVLSPIGGRTPGTRTGVAASLLNANTYLIVRRGGGYFDASANLNMFLHTWSLSVEEQFYLVFPALLLVAWRIGRRWDRGPRATCALMLLIITASSFALSWAASTNHAGLAGGHARDFAFYSSPTRAWQFAVGALLALLLPAVSRLPRVAGEAAAICGVALVIGAALEFDSTTAFPGTAALWPTAGTALLLVAGSGVRQSTVSQLLGRAGMQKLGDMSYSWYLWHWPAIVFALAWFSDSKLAAVIAAGLSYIPAWLSYRFVESPIRFASRPRPRRTIALAVVCLLGSSAVGVVSGATGSALEDRSDLRIFNEMFRQHEANWQHSGTGRSAYLLGDSNAAQFSEPFIAAVTEADETGTISTKTACPIVDLVELDSGLRDQGCRQFVEDELTALETQRPDVVILVSASDIYVNEDRFGLIDTVTKIVAHSAAAKADLWEVGLRRVVSRLSSAGLRVVVVHPIPKYPGWDPRSCATGRWLLAAKSCGTSLAREAAIKYRASALAAETKAVANIPRTETIDVFDVFCPGRECSTTNAAGVWLWRDGRHISVDGALLLSSKFAHLIEG